MRNWVFKFGLVTLLLAATAIQAGATSTALDATAEDGILVFESPDHAFKWWFDARVYIDAAAYFDDSPLYDPDSDDYGDYEDFQDSLAGGAFLRRVRFAIKTQIWDDWYAEVDMDFAEEAAAVKDAYMSYRGLFGGNGRVRVGNFRQPFGLEEVTTSRNLMFMERSQGTEPFVVGRRVGVEVTKWTPDFRWSASMFGADVEDYYKEANEQVSFAARLNYTPINTEESTLMIGGSATYQKPTFEGGSVKYNTRPESNVSDTKFVYAKIKDIDKYNVFGGELAYVNKRLTFQGEYMAAKIDVLEEDDSISYSGGYAMVSYFLTDDSRKYDYTDAEFSRIIPNTESGAWEIAARVSTVDLNDEDAGEENGASTSYTLGVNYYPNPNVKLMLNYGYVDNDEYATGGDDQFFGDYDFSYLQMRFQTAF